MIGLLLPAQTTDVVVISLVKLLVVSVALFIHSTRSALASSGEYAVFLTTSLSGPMLNVSANMPRVVI